LGGFLRKIAIFLAPFVALAASFVLLDPFKVVRSYDSFGSHNPVALDVDYISTEMYLRNRSSAHYDSFIFGNSRTLALRADAYAECIGDGHPFRYPADGESVYGVKLKVDLIDSLGDDIRNALILVDEQMLGAGERPDEHLYVRHPRLTGGSWIDFYSTYIKAYLGDAFFLKYWDYRIFGTFRPYMQGELNPEPMRIDPATNDLFFPGKDEAIAEDSDGYYREAADSFRKYRETHRHDPKPVIDAKRRAWLGEIASVFGKHGTSSIVIVSPNYDQVPLAGEDLGILEEVFGEGRVHDYSGVNAITSDMRNYYEPRHIRPEVGRRMLEEICGSGADAVRAGMARIAGEIRRPGWPGNAPPGAAPGRRPAPPLPRPPARPAPDRPGR